jgi:hypothetical protein
MISVSEADQVHPDTSAVVKVFGPPAMSAFAPLLGLSRHLARELHRSDLRVHPQPTLCPSPNPGRSERKFGSAPKAVAGPRYQEKSLPYRH